MDHKELLIIFVKNPEPGQVKTRLAAAVGEQQAVWIYHRLLAYTREVVEPVPADKQVWYAPVIPDADGWPPYLFQKRLQEGDDLGARMSHAFSSAFAEGYQRVIIIGSDCAQLKTSMLREAFSMFDDSDLVVGPAADGGYYLLGMNAFQPGLFQNITWSTPSVLPETMKRAHRLDLEIRCLPELNDVDTEEDWNEVKDKLQITSYPDESSTKCKQNSNLNP